MRNNVGKSPDSLLELYDLSADLGEADNIATKHPDIVKQIDNYMRDAYTPSDLWSFGNNRKKR